MSINAYLCNIDMKRSIITLLFLLLGTGIRAQELVPSYDWAYFERYAASNQALRGSAPLAVVMGDSITDGWFEADSAFFAVNRIVARGISGQVTAHMLVRLRRDVLDLAPRYLVILGGINDIARNLGYISLENTIGNIASMCELAAFHGIRPVLTTLLPAERIPWRKGLTDVPEQIQAFNQAIRTYASENGFLLIDLADLMVETTDGIHPTLAGYKTMEEAVLQALQ